MTDDGCGVSQTLQLTTTSKAQHKVQIGDEKRRRRKHNQSQRVRVMSDKDVRVAGSLWWNTRVEKNKAQ